MAMMSSGTFSTPELTISEIPNTVGLNEVEDDGPGISHRIPDDGTFGTFSTPELTISEIPNTAGLDEVEDDGPGISC